MSKPTPRLLVHGADEAADPERVAASVAGLLARNYLLSLGTATADGQPHVNTCYFAEDGLSGLYILTPPSSRHAELAQRDQLCAVNIVDSGHRVGDPIAGLQLVCGFVPVSPDEAEAAYSAYAAKHPKFREFAKSGAYVYENFESRFFFLALRAGKLIDESEFGPEQYIEFEIAKS